MIDWAARKAPECASCPLHTARGPVFSDGNYNTAKLVYIAQNPAYREIEEGIPLVGPTGRIFNRQLMQAGIKRPDLFITNAVKCETPGNRPPTDKEIQCCNPLLQKELEVCKADTVVLAGEIAWKACLPLSYSTLNDRYKLSPRYLPKFSVNSRMGFVEQWEGRKWMLTPHPASIMRMFMGEQKRGVLKDPWVPVYHLIKAWRIAGKPLPIPKIDVFPAATVAIDLNRVIRETGEFADDFETKDSYQYDEDRLVGIESEPTMCAISWKPYEAVVLTPEMLTWLSPTLENPEIWRYEHNGSFDDFYFAMFCRQRRNLKLDTMEAFHFFKSHIPKKLKPTISGILLTVPYWGRDLVKINEPIYCGMDGISTLLLGQELKKLLVRHLLWEPFFKYGQPLLPILEEWRKLGCKTDIRRALLYRRFLESNVKKGQLLAAKIAGPFFNPNSPTQMQDLLYKKFGLPEQKKKVKVGSKWTQKVTTDAEAKKKLVRWIDQNEERSLKYRVPRLFLHLADYIAGEQAKIEPLNMIEPDFRLHPYWLSHGASSFRIASAPNLQNWPKHDLSKWGTSSQDKDAADPTGVEGQEKLGSLRSLIIPDTNDDVLICCDYDQIELWVYAVQFQVEWLLEMYKNGEYIYGNIYEEVHGPGTFFESGKPRTKEFRLESIDDSKLKHIKAIPLGFIYGRNDEAVSEEYGWPLSEGRKYGNWWRSKTPELPKAYANMSYQMKQKGFVRHVHGQICWFPTQKETEVYNSYGQSPAAMILRSSIIKIQREFNRRGYQNTRMLLSVHDQLLFNVPKVAVQEVTEEVILPIMERPIDQLKGFVFRVTPEISEQWDYWQQGYWKWKEEGADFGKLRRLRS